MQLANTGSFTWLGLWSLAPAEFLTVTAIVVPVCAAMAVPRRFGVSLLAGWIGAAAFVVLYYLVAQGDWYIGGPIVVFSFTLLGLAVVAAPFARAAQPDK